MNQKLISAAFIGVTLVGPFICATCKDKGTVYKKAWAQADLSEAVRQGEIHPAIAARSGAYRTIVEVTCPDCKGELHAGDTRRIAPAVR